MTQDQPSSTATVDEPFIIRFKHSENKPKPENFAKSDEILSPSDIHRKFLQQFSPKSILKNKNQGRTCGNITEDLSNSTDADLFEVKEEVSEVREYNTVNVSLLVDVNICHRLKMKFTKNSVIIVICKLGAW